LPAIVSSLALLLLRSIGRLWYSLECSSATSAPFTPTMSGKVSSLMGSTGVGVLNSKLEDYDKAFYNGPIHVTVIQATLYRLLRELENVYRMTGVQFCLAHDGLLGHYRSRRLLPWSTTMTVLIKKSQLPTLNDFAMWWNTKDAALFAPSVAQQGIIGRIVSKTNGVYITIRVLEATTPSVLASKALRSRPIRAAAKTLHEESLHIYNQDDLFPLRPLSLGGSLIFAPRDTRVVLLQEYGEEPMQRQQWNTYTWSTVLQDWVQASDANLGDPPHVRRQY